MPATRHFVITQERQIRVSAPSMLEAIQRASAEFAGEENALEGTTVHGRIIDRKLSAEENR